MVFWVACRPQSNPNSISSDGVPLELLILGLCRVPGAPVWPVRYTGMTGRRKEAAGVDRFDDLAARSSAFECVTRFNSHKGWGGPHQVISRVRRVRNKKKLKTNTTRSRNDQPMAAETRIFSIACCFVLLLKMFRLYQNQSTTTYWKQQYSVTSMMWCWHTLFLHKMFLKNCGKPSQNRLLAAFSFPSSYLSHKVSLIGIKNPVL